MLFHTEKEMKRKEKRGEVKRGDGMERTQQERKGKI
jgi:hypothetical protein